MHKLYRMPLLVAVAMAAAVAVLVVDPTIWNPSHHSIVETLAVAVATIAPAGEKLDILIGAREIANFTGLSENQVYHQAKIGVLPVTRQGSLLIGSKSRLREHFSAQVERVPAEVGGDPPWRTS